MRLEGKVALISGGARGQGAGEARLFAREGAAVVIADILDEEGLKVEAEIRELGGRATYVHLDVTDPDQWESAVARTVSEYGKLNILVNSAGVGAIDVAGLGAPKIHDTDTAVWDTIMDVNSKGCVPRDPGCHPCHARRRRGFHHQHLLHCGTHGHRPRQRVLGRLLILQGVSSPPHQGHCGPARTRGNTLQLGAPWLYRNSDDSYADVAARCPRTGCSVDAFEPHRRGGRHCLRGAVPGVGRVLVHDRQRVGDRRRHDC